MASVSPDAQQAPSTVGTAGSNAGSPRPPSSVTREVPMEASSLPSTAARLNSVPSSSRRHPPLLRPRSPPSPRPSNQAVVVARTAAERWSGRCLFFLFSLKNVCRVFFLHSAKCLSSAQQKTLGKECLPRNLYRVLVVECNTRQRVCRLFVWLCRVPLALGKPPV